MDHENHEKKDEYHDSVACFDKEGIEIEIRQRLTIVFLSGSLIEVPENHSARTLVVLESAMSDRIAQVTIFPSCEEDL